MIGGSFRWQDRDVLLSISKVEQASNLFHYLLGNLSGSMLKTGPQWLQMKEAIPELKRATSHHSSQTRCWVLQAIGKFGTGGDLAFLANRLYDSALIVRLCAAQAIEVITGEGFGFPAQSGLERITDQRTSA